MSESKTKRSERGARPSESTSASLEKPSESTSESESAEPKLSAFQKYRIVRVHRSQLVNAPYNPRVIDERAKAKLKKNLKKVGLVEAPTWNETTGHVLAGHQRLALLDLLTGHGNYLLDVAATQLDPKVEREQNVFMNNPTAQGSWDITALGDLLKSGDFDYQASGFDRLDLEVAFTDTDLASIFGADKATAEVAADLARVGAVIEPKPAKTEPGQPEGAEGEGPALALEPLGEGEEIDPGTPIPAPSGEAPTMRRSDAVKQYMTTRDAEIDTEIYAVVVFNSGKERAIFMSAIGADGSQRYVDGSAVFDKLGIDPSGPWSAAYDAAAPRA